MRGNWSYMWLFILAVLLQTFLFGNLTISTLLVIHVYPIFILSLPINTSQIKMIFLTTLLGVALDVMCGGNGLYTISCVGSGVFRIALLKLMLGPRDGVNIAIPSARSLEPLGFFLFVTLYMAIHLAIFIGVESIGIENITFIALRYAISLSVSTIFVLLLLRATSNRELN